MNSNTFVLNETNDDKKSQFITAQNSTLICRISPLIVMAILNHFQRRPSNKQLKNQNQPQHLYPNFVIGLLFGHKQTNSIVVNDAFGLEIQLNPEDQVTSILLYQSSSKKKSQIRIFTMYQTGSGSKCR